MPEISAKALLRAVDVLNRVPYRPGIASSEFVRVKYDGKTMVFTLASEVRGEVGVKAPGDDKWGSPFFLERTSFFPFINQAANGASASFTVTRGKSGLTFVFGRRRGVFNLVQDVTGYDMSGKGADKALPIPDEFGSAFSLASTFASTDKTEEARQCVHSNGSYLFAADQTAAIRVPLKMAYKGPLPLGFDTLAGIENSKASYGDHGFRVEYDGGYVFTSANAAHSKFPSKQYADLFERLTKNAVTFAADGERWVATIGYLKTCIALALDPVVTFTGKKGESHVFATAAVQSATFREKLRIRGSLSRDISEQVRMQCIAKVAPEEQVELIFAPDLPHVLRIDGKTCIALSRAAK